MTSGVWLLSEKRESGTEQILEFKMLRRILAIIYLKTTTQI